MFRPAQHLKQNGDPAYAKACREAIYAAEGTEVVFPEPPAGESPPASASSGTN
jgi:hypothetical protein